MDSSNLDTTEEIVIVGSRHGVLADIVKPLFEKGEPIKKKDIKKILGGDEVLIYPESNEYDKYAVGVFTRSHRPLGHVWSSQSPAVSEWMAKHKRGYIRGRIEEVITKNGLMMARVDTPMLLQRTSRSSRWDDCDWANDLPEVVTNNVNRSLKVCIELLKDELRKATEWNEDLQFRIDNLIEYLQLDLSAHCNDEGNVLFGMMNHSEIEEVRAQCYDVASAFVNRGSKSHMEWWIKEWLPQFLKDASKGNLMKIFEDDDYDLERVEETLRLAPERLFYLYKYERERFACALYYSDFPESLYFRFLTLLAVWEAMRGINLNDNLNDNEEQCLMEALRQAQEPGRCMTEDVDEKSVLSNARQSKLNEIIEILQNGNWKEPATTENITLLLNTIFGRDSSLLDEGDESHCEEMWTLVEGGGGDRMVIVPANLAGFFKEENLLIGSSKNISKDLFGERNNQINNINKGNPKFASKSFNEIIPFLKKYIDKIIR